mmetsp:Transcript_8311/g.1113  ORF Transcript_8311/g.1113 Transcript_8311/m.1113 type:complete len:87 (+) Transcript_8311:50-310(+)
MCKHISNVQVQVKTECCEKFFDCQFCHDTTEEHEYKKHEREMTFKCKDCNKEFEKDMSEFEEADGYCPHCDNEFVVEPKFNPDFER